MKKNLFSLVAALLFIANSNAQNVYIPDTIFKAVLVGNPSININNDSDIQVSEANAYTGYINVENMLITDLTGISAFINIDSLNCSNNFLLSLDLSANAALTYLLCGGNWLLNLDVSANALLTILDCSVNQLTNLNLSSNTALTEFGCGGNQLASLNVSGCTVLNGLYCDLNQLTSLNVSSCISLTVLVCSDNQIQSLDVSGNTLLTDLLCTSNMLTNLNILGCTALIQLNCDYNQLQSLNASSNVALSILRCGINQLTSLNIQNGNNSNFVLFDAIGNPNLNCVQVDNPSYMNTYWSGNIGLTTSFSNDCPTACQALYTVTPNLFANNFWYIINQCMGTDSLSSDSLNYVWSWGDSLNSTSTGAYPSFTYSSPGNYVICVTITDTISGCTSTYCDSSYISRKSLSNQMITVNVIPANSPLLQNGILTHSSMEKADLSLFPNPTNGSITIQCSVKNDTPIDIVFKIVDLIGKEILNGKLTSNNTVVDLSNVANGVYFMKVGAEVVKFIKE